MTLYHLPETLHWVDLSFTSIKGPRNRVEIDNAILEFHDVEGARKWLVSGFDVMRMVGESM